MAPLISYARFVLNESPLSKQWANDVYDTSRSFLKTSLHRSLTILKKPSLTFLSSLLASRLPFDPPTQDPGYGIASSSSLPNTTVRYIKNSGVCETTPGVNTYSGYVDEEDDHMWFWFFEARKEPEKADFVVWFNGGPGCSSMIGLFQEHGPCTVNKDDITTTLNPYSWNEVANVIYVDQPIGTGFSYGPSRVNSSLTAAPYIWKFFQILFANDEFSKFESRSFSIFSESYGGHYGPAFASFFGVQNGRIDRGEIEGEKINLASIGLNDAWIEPLIQTESFPEYAFNNGYERLINETVYENVKRDFYRPGGCKDLELRCYETGTDRDCEDADTFCTDYVMTPASGGRDLNYILAPKKNPLPPDNYVKFLNNPLIQKKIGAEKNFKECSGRTFQNFNSTGDDGRTFLSVMTDLMNSGLRVTLWAGELDYICNWLGMAETISQMWSWNGLPEFLVTPYSELTVEGRKFGLVKNIGNFSFARIHRAGHLVPYYEPEGALQVFAQTIRGEKLTST